MKRDPEIICEACQYNAPLRAYGRGVADDGAPMKLCRLCASTRSGNAFQHLSAAGDAAATSTTCFASNAILDALGVLWPGADAPRADRESVEVGFLEAEVERLKHENKSLDAQIEEAIAQRDLYDDRLSEERRAHGVEARKMQEKIVRLEARLAVSNVAIPEETKDGFEEIENDGN